ncbi:MAG: glycosyltransferase family 4 protein [Acidimicrobiia bacterium]|nr:glycosyltransferase family 4 protein [Acidimicrobiia bacterium]
MVNGPWLDDPVRDGTTPGRIVILLENLPVERDRRVWRQARALVRHGLAVTVVCPASEEWASGSGGRGSRRRTVDGVEIRSFVPARERSGVLGFVLEYLVALAKMTWILRRLHRSSRIGGIQVCNPPDIFFAVGWWARRRGIPFLFDQHDLCPELFLTRFGAGPAPGADRRVPAPLVAVILAVLRRCERETYLSASRVIATNDSYRRVAIERGGVGPRDVVVVRNGPDPERMRPNGSVSRSGGDRRLVVWMGNIGPQDGVDDAVRAVAHLVRRIGRTDTDFVFIGRGEARAAAMAVAEQLDLDRYVTFTGWIPDDEAFALLSAADVGLSADPPGPLNNCSTMNKTLEYMAFGLPVVAHDLHETRISAGPAAVYAADGTPEALARCLDRLLDDPDRMASMGREGRRRIEARLGWPHQAAGYVALWQSVLGLDPKPVGSPASTAPVLSPVVATAGQRAENSTMSPNART